MIDLLFFLVMTAPLMVITYVMIIDTMEDRAP